MAKKGKKNRVANRRVAYQQASVMPKSKAINPVVIGIVTVAMIIVLGFSFLTQVTGGSTVAGSSSASGAGGSISSSQQQTINSLESTLKADPKNLGVLIQLGDSYYDSKQFGPAIDRYSQALEIDPSNVNARVDLGTSYLSLGMSSQAIDAYKKALEIDPNKTQAHFNLGNALIDPSNPNANASDAIAEWNKAIQTAGGDQNIVKQAQALINQYQGK